MIIDLGKRDLITIEDLSNREIEAVFRVADQMAENMIEQFGVCRGKVMASLFFEPSTRTRLSFETAMNRLGGSVISVTDIGNTSLAKGESIADMARVVGRYADIIVIRHPWEGAAKVVADYADVPVINAGDGGHQHPSQTLLDLYTLKKKWKTLKGLNVALLGDLKYGRTVHSLVFALARFGALMNFRQSPGVEMPSYVLRKLREYGLVLRKYPNVNDSGSESGSTPFDVIYVSPPNQARLPMETTDIDIQIKVRRGGHDIEVMNKVDALYVTRRQKERFKVEDGSDEIDKIYPVVDKKLLQEEKYRKAIVMHPLPRVGELAYEMDADPRSMYFKQAGFGVPVRMALLSLLLGAKSADMPERRQLSFVEKKEFLTYEMDTGVRCQNEKCVSVQETEKRYIKPKFEIVSTTPLTLRCAYCEQETPPEYLPSLYIASSKWHQGLVENKRYYKADSFMLGRIRPENLIIFGSGEDARRQGFKLGKRAI
jgi:aspartate carbamoyltransferase catalytic subunit